MSSSSSSSSPQASRSWTQLKEEGRLAFEQEQYELALAKYQEALSSGGDSGATSTVIAAHDRQVLLSNVVACRLQLGSRMHLLAAKEEARQCVALNPRWAKAHVRLGSVYQALGGPHSNDACQCFQRALQLDPTNPTARRLLTQELRRGTPSTTGEGSAAAAAASSTRASAPSTPSYGSNSNSDTPTPSAPPFPAETVDSSTFAPASSASTRAPEDRGRTRPDDGPFDVDDSSSWSQRFQCSLLKVKLWYTNLSDDVQSLLWILCGLLLLYVAFGGRFGLGTSGSHNPSDFFDTATSRAQYPYQAHHGSGRGRGTDQDWGSASTSGYHSDYHDRGHYHRHGTSSSWSWSLSDAHLPNLFDGSVSSMMILAGIAYGCHKMGVSPYHAIWMLRMMQGGGRGGRRGMGMGMGYGSFGGGGFGRARRRW